MKNKYLRTQARSPIGENGGGHATQCDMTFNLNPDDGPRVQ